MTPAMAEGSYKQYGHGEPGRAAGIVVAVAMHAAAILLLLQYEPARQALIDVAPIMVNIIAPPIVEKPQEPPKPLPVKPKVVEKKRPLDPPPVLTAAPTEAPAPYVAPPPPPPAPAPEPVAAPPAPPAPVIPPNFNADYLQNPPPAYPAVARRMGQQGRVILRVLVNPDGLPNRVEIRTGSGVAALDEAALDAVRRWRFVPARQGDQAVTAWVLVPIVFTLER